MSNQCIKIIYNEDSAQFEAYNCSESSREYLLFAEDDAESLTEMIIDSIDELKASC